MVVDRFGGGWEVNIFLVTFVLQGGATQSFPPNPQTSCTTQPDLPAKPYQFGSQLEPFSAGCVHKTDSRNRSSYYTVSTNFLRHKLPVPVGYLRNCFFSSSNYGESFKI